MPLARLGVIWPSSVRIMGAPWPSEGGLTSVERVQNAQLSDNCYKVLSLQWSAYMAGWVPSHVPRPMEFSKGSFVLDNMCFFLPRPGNTVFHHSRHRHMPSQRRLHLRHSTPPFRASSSSSIMSMSTCHSL